MTQTILTAAAAERLRAGLPWVLREEIASIEGDSDPAEPVELLDSNRLSLGVGDMDLDRAVAAWRLGAPGEEASGILARLLRRALERRARSIEDPRYCRLVHGEGDGLPGLFVDRYDSHLIVEASTPAMRARLPELTRELRELLSCASILQQLPDRPPHVLFGTPPRWSRIQERGARITFDLTGRRAGYPYQGRELRHAIAGLAAGVRMLDIRCGLGDRFVQAARGGARSVVALEEDRDLAELARENAEANGLLGRAEIVDWGEPPALNRPPPERCDLVVLDLPPDPEAAATWLRFALAAVAPRGCLAVLSHSLPSDALDSIVADVCEAMGRWAVCVGRPALPSDFPVLLRRAPSHSALTLELD